MTVEMLQSMFADGTFHHATYRFDGVWQGLWIYRKSDGFRGFEPAGCFNCYKQDHPELDAAYEVLRQHNHGHSVGAYGRG